MFADLSLNLAASVIYDFGKAVLNAADKTETVQLARKKLGVATQLNDFPDRYLEALVELRFEKKSKVVLDFFRSEDIMKTFYNYYYGSPDQRKNDNAHTAALDQHIEALQVGDAVKAENVDVAIEVNYFWTIFKQKVHESRTVREVEIDQQLGELKTSTQNAETLLQQLNDWLHQREAENIELEGQAFPLGNAKIQQALTQRADKIFNIEHIETAHFYIYGERKIPPILTAPTASVPVTFLGREKELQEIRALLNRSNGTLALVNSEGGMGKTTLAAAYWNQYRDQYKHLAWLFCENGILSALRSQLPQPLGLQEEMNAYADSPENQAIFLKNHLANCEKDCLLVLDNANDPDQIKAFLSTMNGLGWHVLMTSRCTKLYPEYEYPIKSLPPELAKELFIQNYSEDGPEFEALLDRFLKAVGYNTLCIEIFSKNLREGGSWGYSFAEFLKQLEQGGLFLGDNSFYITTDYTHNVGKPAENSDDILRVLYNLSDLTPEATDLLVQFALLPAENHPPELLQALLSHESKHELKRGLDLLAQKGWLTSDAKNYRLSPMVQKIVLHQHIDRRWSLAEPMVKKLHAIFENDGYLPRYITTAAPFAALVFGLVENIDTANEDIAMLFDRVWVYYTAIGNLAQALDTATRMTVICKNYGHKNNLANSFFKLGSTYTELDNLEKALTFFEKGIKLSKELYETEPNNELYKNGLAISYSKLGITHTALDNIDKALTFCGQGTKLFEELHETYQNNESYKNGLAISYSTLGETHRTIGNWDEALVSYKMTNQIFKELYEANPNNVSFKNGLAISYEKLGSTHTALGNLDKALTFFETYNRLEKELYKTYPSKVSYKNSLAISYAKLAQFSRDQLKDNTQSKEYFLQAEQLWMELVVDAPQFVEFKKLLDMVRDEMAKLEE